uniref:hypothetical protein n=1 Tax=Xanthomonas albilineans TaxID=29447 RepID=UPI0027DCB024|nr:hypothetical protein [Xanthomonas albilineans]
MEETREQRAIGILEGKVAALEYFIEDFMHLLIAASLNREQIEREMSKWALQETGEDQEHHYRVELAAQVLERLQSL